MEGNQDVVIMVSKAQYEDLVAEHNSLYRENRDNEETIIALSRYIDELERELGIPEAEDAPPVNQISLWDDPNTGDWMDLRSETPNDVDTNW